MKNQLGVTLLVLLGMTMLALGNPLPDYYEEPGINPLREYEINSPKELIDPLSGGLQRQYVDFAVPGNAGLDIVVRRFYKASSAAPGIVGHNYFQGNSALGLNWDIHFGRIWHGSSFAGSGTSCGTGNVRSGSNPVLELSDGSRKELLDDETATGYGYVTQDLWIGICNQGKLEVVSPNGYRYKFDLFMPINGTSVWHATEIQDPFGNALTITYYQNAKPLVNQISSTDGRAVTFHYNSTTVANPLLKEVRLNGSWRVKYNHKAITGVSGANYLDNVERRDEGGLWQYKYYETTPTNGFGRHNLNEVTAPTGLKTTYTYKGVYFTPNKQNTAIDTKSVTGAAVEPVTWTHTYSPASGAQSYDVTTIVSDNYCTKYEHRGAALASNGNVWRIGTLEEIRRYNAPSCSSSHLIETEQFQWEGVQVSDQDLGHRRSAVYDSNSYMPVLTSKTVIRDGDTFFTDYLSFDVYGNPQTIVESGPNSSSRTTTITYENFDDVDTWIIGKMKTKSITGEGVIEDNDYYTTGVRRGALQQISIFGRQPRVFDYYTSGSSKGALSSETNENGKTTTYSGYYRGIPEQVSLPENITITRNVNSTGTIEWETDGRGKTRSYSYDYMNRLLSITTPKITDSDISVAWSNGGRTRTVTRGSFTSVHTVNGYGQLVNMNVEGVKKTFQYNEEGYLVFESYPSTTTPASGTNYTKDVLDRVKVITNPDATTIVYNYNPQEGANATSVLDERVKKTVYYYRSFGDPSERHLITIGAPESITTIIGRDKLGNQTSVTQGGATRTYNLNSKKLLDSELHPETGTTDLTLDDMGNVTYKKVGSAAATNIVYDDLNRIDLINYPTETPDVDFEYDGNGNVREANNSVANWSYTYDDNNNLETETVLVLGMSLEIEYGYNGLDHLSSITYPNGLTISLSPNELGQPTTIGSFANNISYHANGSMNTLTFGNSKTIQHVLDNRLRIDTINQGGLGLGVLEYDYDAAGNVKGMTDSFNTNNNLTLTYDDANRLKTANGPWGTGSFGYTTTGDLDYKNIGGLNLDHHYSPTSQKLTSITGGRSFSFGYDSYGNVSSNGVDTFVYNDASQLVLVPLKDLKFAYDANNRRIVKYVGGVPESIMLYNQAGQLMYEADRYNDYQVAYIYLGTRLIAKREFCQNGDGDGDGLDSCTEKRIGLNTSLIDSDGDGISDSEEDSDGDGMPNLYEYINGQHPGFNDAQGDLDGDGSSNISEYEAGTNPQNPDSDNDGLMDGIEIIYGTDPLDADTDGDGVSDGDEVAAGTNPLFNFVYILPAILMLLN